MQELIQKIIAMDQKACAALEKKQNEKQNALNGMNQIKEERWALYEQRLEKEMQVLKQQLDDEYEAFYKKTKKEFNRRIAGLHPDADKKKEWVDQLFDNCIKGNDV